MAQNSSNWGFGRLLKFWRGVRKLSQEGLAFELGCSNRHLVRIESGKGHPSEKLVDDIATALHLGQRDWSHLRMAAGYTHNLQASDISVPEYEWLREVLLRTLNTVDPFPAVVADSGANIRMVNRGWVEFFQPLLPPDVLQNQVGLWDLLFPYAAKGSELVLSCIVMSAQQQACFSGRPDDQAFVDRLASYEQVPSHWAEIASMQEPRANFELTLELGGKEQSFSIIVSTISAHGPTAYLFEPYLFLYTFYPQDHLDELGKGTAQDLKHQRLNY